MKKQYAAITTTALEIEGEILPDGSTIATLESYFDSDRVQSLFDNRILFLIPAADVAKSEPATSEAGQSDNSIIEESITESLQPEPESMQEPTIEAKAADAFPGLKPRIAIALYSQKIQSVSQLRHYILDNKDLLDLDGIGKAASAEVIAWLNADGGE